MLGITQEISTVSYMRMSTMDRMTEIIEKDLQYLAKINPTLIGDAEVGRNSSKIQLIIAELLLDIREELRQIKKSQGDSKWGSKL